MLPPASNQRTVCFGEEQYHRLACDHESRLGNYNPSKNGAAWDTALVDGATLDVSLVQNEAFYCLEDTPPVCEYSYTA